MRICCVISVVVLSIASLSLASNEEPACRTFTVPDGRTISAVVVNHNSRNGKIQILHEGGGKVWVPASSFSEQDQEYIRQWIVVDRFMSATGLKISGKLDKGTTEYEYGNVHGEKVKTGGNTDVTCLITLDNKMDLDLNNLTVEYRAFILNQGNGKRPDSERIEGGQFEIDCLAAEGRMQKITDVIRLRTVFSTTVLFYTTGGFAGTSTSKLSEERLEGIWVRVYGPSIDGQRAIREWCHPADTMDDYEWKDVSRPAKKDWKTLGIAPDSLARTNPAEALKLMHADYEKDADPEIAKNIGYTYLWLVEPHDIPAGLEWLKKATEGDNESACRLLSGFYSTYYGHMNYLDVEQAVLYGEKALSLKMDQFPHITMALAYARGGQFEKAVEHQQQAIQLYKDWIKEKKSDAPSDSYDKMKQSLEDMQLKLELYKNGKME